MSYKGQKWEHKVASPVETRTLSSAFITERRVDSATIVDRLSLKIIPETINITGVLPFYWGFKLDGIPKNITSKNLCKYFNLEEDTLIFDRVDMLQHRIQEFLNKDLSLPEIFAVLDSSLNKSELVGLNNKILELGELLDDAGVYLPLGITKVIEALKTENIAIERYNGDTIFLQPALREIIFCDRPDLKVYTLNLEYLYNRDYSAYNFNHTDRDGSSVYNAILDTDGCQMLLNDLSRGITADNKPPGMNVAIYCIIEGLISVCIYENLCLKCFKNWIELMKIKSKETYATNADFAVFLEVFYDTLFEILHSETTGVRGCISFIGGNYTALSYMGDHDAELVESLPFTLYEKFIRIFFSGISIGNDQGFSKIMEEFRKLYNHDNMVITGTDKSEDLKILDKIIEVAEALHNYFIKKEVNYIDISALHTFVVSKFAWYYYHEAYTRYVTIGEHRMDNQYGIQKKNLYNFGPIDLMRLGML